MGYTTYSAVGVPSTLFIGVGLYMVLTGTPAFLMRALASTDKLMLIQARARDLMSVLSSKKQIRILGPLSASVSAWDSVYSVRVGASEGPAFPRLHF